MKWDTTTIDYISICCILNHGAAPVHHTKVVELRLTNQGIHQPGLLEDKLRFWRCTRDTQQLPWDFRCHSGVDTTLLNNYFLKFRRFREQCFQKKHFQFGSTNRFKLDCVKHLQILNNKATLWILQKSWSSFLVIPPTWLQLEKKWKT